jgi:hypothetical protein
VALLTTNRQRLKERETVQEQLVLEREKENELLNTLLKKDAELKKLKKESKEIVKNCEKIKQSRVWKCSFLIKFVSLRKRLCQSLKFNLFASKLNELIEQNKMLIDENHQLQTKLEGVTSKLEKKSLIDPKLSNSGQLRKEIKAVKEEGQLLEYLDTLIQRKQVSDENYHAALSCAAKLYKNEKMDLKKAAYSKVLTGLKLDAVPEFIVREAETEDDVSLQTLSSFQASLALRSRKRQLGETLPEWVLEDKLAAYRFVDTLNVKRPWVSEKLYPAGQIPRKTGIVIKPSDGAGSRGVYLVFGHDHIQDVKRGLVLTSWDALCAQMNKDLEQRLVRADEWITEELILEGKQPARDLKFYCFYGEVALVLEIKRIPELKYCWWTADGRRIQTGKYEEELFKGDGFSKEELEQAAVMSKEIPTPFIRIDFLKTEKELVFGEFTPKPGNYDEFDQSTNQWLGDYFLEAEGRLMADLLHGKQFTHYNKCHLQHQLITNG